MACIGIMAATIWLVAEKMKKLPSHFDGRRFRNLLPRRNGFGALLRWLLSRRQGQWRVHQNSASPSLPPRKSERLRITFINHSTFLLQLKGINILTDPVWSERASPVSWMGPRRYRAPGISIHDLPPIDLVLLSHDHYDHMDLPTLQLLAREHRPTIYTGLKNGRVLAKHGIGNVVELDWWQEAAARSDMWITAVPGAAFLRTRRLRPRQAPMVRLRSADRRRSALLRRRHGRRSAHRARSRNAFLISIWRFFPSVLFVPSGLWAKYICRRETRWTLTLPWGRESA